MLTAAPRSRPNSVTGLLSAFNTLKNAFLHLTRTAHVEQVVYEAPTYSMFICPRSFWSPRRKKKQKATFFKVFLSFRFRLSLSWSLLLLWSSYDRLVISQYLVERWPWWPRGKAWQQEHKELPALAIPLRTDAHPRFFIYSLEKRTPMLARWIIALSIIRATDWPSATLRSPSSQKLLQQLFTMQYSMYGATRDGKVPCL